MTYILHVAAMMAGLILLGCLCCSTWSFSAGGVISMASSSKGSRKAKSKRGNVPAAQGLGFGAGSKTVAVQARTASVVTAQDALPNNDYATFPPLSPETLASLQGIGATSDGYTILSPEDEEIVQRVQQICGFENFDKAIPLFPGLKVLHRDPVVIAVDDFFTPEECDQYIAMSSENGQGRAFLGPASSPAPAPAPHRQRSATMSSDTDAASQRTSTTWFHHFAAAPELMSRSSSLLGISFDDQRWEEPQTVRYRAGEKFTWHLDALPPTPELAGKGGQRVVTLLVYLTELAQGAGGATAFRDLGPLRVRPRKGMALLFFPSLGGIPGCPFDIRTLHAGEVVEKDGDVDKWIAQLWLREGKYRPVQPPGNTYAGAQAIVADFDARWRKTVV